MTPLSKRLRCTSIRMCHCIVSSHLSILGGEVSMHVPVAIGHDWSEIGSTRNAKLVQCVPEEEDAVATKVGLVAGHIF